MGSGQSKTLAPMPTQANLPGSQAPSVEVDPLLTQAKDTSSVKKSLGASWDNGILSKCDTIQKAEYIFYIGAQLSRLAYCDSGILQESLKALGEHPDILNGVIGAYDWKYLGKKRSYTKGVPAPDSFTDINHVCGDKSQKPLVKYISSPTDTTCFILNPVAIKPNANSIITAEDIIITHKGSSSLRNWSKNISAAKSTSLNDSLGLSKTVTSNTRAQPDFKVTTSYLEPLLEILQNILDGILEVAPGNPPKRIFVFGHSKGGAECEIFGMLLALMMKDKANYPALINLEEIHIISYGAPKILASSSYNDFNKQILQDNEGRVTLTRIESVGRLAGDSVTNLPPWGVHPGDTVTSNTIDIVRGKYGVKVDGNYRRNPDSWPFENPYDLWESNNKALLDQKVKAITNLEAPPPQPEEPQIEEPATGGYYVKVKGARNTVNPHVEYLGMYFMGSQRLAGMKNPANTADKRTFTASILKDTSCYVYLPWEPLRSGVNTTIGTALTNTIATPFSSTLGSTTVPVGILQGNLAKTSSTIFGKGRKVTRRKNKKLRRRTIKK